MCVRPLSGLQNPVPASQLTPEILGCGLPGGAPGSPASSSDAAPESGGGKAGDEGGGIPVPPDSKDLGTDAGQEPGSGAPDTDLTTFTSDEAAGSDEAGGEGVDEGSSEGPFEGPAQEEEAAAPAPAPATSEGRVGSKSLPDSKASACGSCKSML